MKKLISALLAGAMVFSLSACGGCIGNNAGSNPPGASNATAASNPPAGSIPTDS